jgi:hypothetical protein
MKHIMDTEPAERQPFGNDSDDMLKADGFDAALIGVASRCGQPDVLAYDANKCAEILQKRDGMDTGEAWEFLEFNTFSAYVGKGTPVFIRPLTAEERMDATGE